MVGLYTDLWNRISVVLICWPIPLGKLAQPTAFKSDWGARIVDVGVQQLDEVG